MTDQSGEAPIIRDRRRIDPETGQARPDAAAAPTLNPSAVSEPAATDLAEDGTGAPANELAAELAAALEERTADLQRLQAEYTNYRRRVERDREAVAEQALASVMLGLLPVLDDIDRAKAHGEASQGFILLADGLDATVTKLGLTRFGEAGEPFDPTIHEALTHAGESDEVDASICSEIYQPGFRVGERILRPARVAVLDPVAVAVIDAEVVEEDIEET